MDNTSVSFYVTGVGHYAVVGKSGGLNNTPLVSKLKRCVGMKGVNYIFVVIYFQVLQRIGTVPGG